ncbi:MAG TPA: hypothetical protein VHW65_08900 [Gemmatimonadales bacterium]|jgi:hypothetical protein|nr:hypothetical protein [Gemmatimonadales bacterium]
MQPGLVVLAAILALRCVALPAQAYTAIEAKEFDRGDRESRELLQAVNCLNRLRAAVQENRVVQYAKWMDARQCLVIGQHYVWVAMGGDTTLNRPTRVMAYDLTTGAPYAEPLDTTRVAAIARAERSAILQFGSAFDEHHPGVPLTFRFDGDSIALNTAGVSSMLSATPGTPWVQVVRHK